MRISFRSSVALSSMLPIKPPPSHCCRNVSARWTEVLAGHSSSLKDRDVRPISHRPCGLCDIKLKIHIEILGHTQIAKNLKTSTNGKNIQQHESLYSDAIGWPLLRGWPSVARYECRLRTVWVSIVTPLAKFAKGNIAPPLHLTSQDTEGELDAGPCKRAVSSSWGCVRVSWAVLNSLVFVQRELCVVHYLKRVIITLVIGVLTGLRSCQKAMYPGNAWRTAGPDVRVPVCVNLCTHTAFIFLLISLRAEWVYASFLVQTY